MTRATFVRLPALMLMAVQIIDAAEAEARTNKWNVTIVVTVAAGGIK